MAQKAERGVVIRIHGGFCYVAVRERVLESALRGKLKVKDSVLVGDSVIVEDLGDGKGLVTEVLSRRSQLIRPRIANVDLVVLVFSFSEPDPVLDLLDRMLIQTEASAVPALIVLNKADLQEDPEPEWIDMYRNAGYTVLVTSAVTGDGLVKLKEILRGRIAVLAGPSGAGKSSLTNLLIPVAGQQTGTVSRKLGRGRHTTRVTELFSLPSGGYVGDAPGFSSLALPSVPRDELALLFPEMQGLIGKCRFTDCLHDQEPDCAIKAAVERGNIATIRYGHYLDFLQEIRERERRNPRG